jgi:hypothetical protein
MLTDESRTTGGEPGSVGETVVSPDAELVVPRKPSVEMTTVPTAMTATRERDGRVARRIVMDN